MCLGMRACMCGKGGYILKASILTLLCNFQKRNQPREDLHDKIYLWYYHENPGWERIFRTDIFISRLHISRKTPRYKLLNAISLPKTFSKFNQISQKLLNKGTKFRNKIFYFNYKFHFFYLNKGTKFNIHRIQSIIGVYVCL